MTQPVCNCGHEKRDHVAPRRLTQDLSTCKVCLCNHYVRKIASPGEKAGSRQPAVSR